MHPFAYHRPDSLETAAALLSGDPEAKALSGGMSLLPALKLRLSAPSRLVDLSSVAGLRGISVDSRRARIAALTTHAAVAASDELRRVLPALTALAGGIADVQVRYRGTIGGSVANADPAADYPAALVGLDAIVHTHKRTIAADHFFTGLFETALEPGEIITLVEFPLPDQAVYLKFANQASRYAIVGLFLARFGGRVRVAVTGAASRVFRAHAFEEALSAAFSEHAIAGLRLDAQDLLSDLHAPAEYRAHLVGILARRAVRGCLEEPTRSGSNLSSASPRNEG
jgi:carbon-monoxide dehydrogenase medium subunit